MNAFEITPEKLSSLVDPKNPELLEQLGGVEGLLKKLKVDGSKGLPQENLHDTAASPALTLGSDKSPVWELDNDKVAVLETSNEERRMVFGVNELPETPQKSIFYLMWLALHSQLLVCIIMSKSRVHCGIN